MRLLKISIIPLVLFFSTFFIALQSKNSTTVNAEEGPCQAGVNIIQPVAGQLVQDIVPVELAGNTGIVKVVFTLDEDIIGRARPIPQSGNQWTMVWDTWLSEPGGPQELSAKVFYGNGNVCETTNTLPVTIGNPEQFPLQGSLQPPFWSGLTNSIAIYNVEFFGAGTTTGGLSEFAEIKWSVSGRGSVQPLPDGTARYSSGPNSGGGQVRAEVNYGGQKIDLTSDTQIYSTSGSTTSNSESESSESEVENEIESSTSNELPEDSTQPIDSATAIVAALESDEVINSCLQNQLGSDELERLIREGKRPSSEEFREYVGCFARQSYVLPSILAPISPDEVPQKQESDKVVINNILNERRVLSENGAEKTVLVLRGKAQPNTNVLIYVYSEPLVLATTADEDGNWSYTLEDPLESGEHEVYALVDRGDGEYERSGVASFFIGTAEASEENPNGYSLELVSEPTISASNRSINVYITATIGLVTFAAVVVFYVVYSKSKKLSTPSGFIDPNAQPIDQNESDYKNFIDSV